MFSYVVKHPGKPAEIKTLAEHPDTLALFQSEVGGYIESPRIPALDDLEERGLSFFCNEEGKLDSAFDAHFLLRGETLDSGMSVYDVFFGPIVAAGYDANTGNTVSLSDELARETADRLNALVALDSPDKIFTLGNRALEAMGIDPRSRRDIDVTTATTNATPTAPRGTLDFAIVSDPSVCVVELLTDGAREWASEHVEGVELTHPESGVSAETAAPGAMHSPVVPIAFIELEAADDFPQQTFIGTDALAAADGFLGRRPRPTMGYDKYYVVVTWEDGKTFRLRHDLESKESDQLHLGESLFREVLHYAGRNPEGLDATIYETHLADSLSPAQRALLQDFATRYQLLDLDAGRDGREPYGLPYPQGRQLAELATGARAVVREGSTGTSGFRPLTSEATAEAVVPQIDDADARRLASEYGDGADLRLASTGSIDGDVRRAILRLRSDHTWPPSRQHELDALATYVQSRPNRGPVPGWSDLPWSDLATLRDPNITRAERFLRAEELSTGAFAFCDFTDEREPYIVRSPAELAELGREIAPGEEARGVPKDGHLGTVYRDWLAAHPRVSLPDWWTLSLQYRIDGIPSEHGFLLCETFAKAQVTVEQIGAGTIVTADHKTGQETVATDPRLTTPIREHTPEADPNARLAASIIYCERKRIEELTAGMLRDGLTGTVDGNPVRLSQEGVVLTSPNVAPRRPSI